MTRNELLGALCGIAEYGDSWGTSEDLEAVAKAALEAFAQPEEGEKVPQSYLAFSDTASFSAYCMNKAKGDSQKAWAIAYELWYRQCAKTFAAATREPQSGSGQEKS